jgi:hypothetical protein
VLHSGGSNRRVRGGGVSPNRMVARKWYVKLMSVSLILSSTLTPQQTGLDSTKTVHSTMCVYFTSRRKKLEVKFKHFFPSCKCTALFPVLLMVLCTFPGSWTLTGHY